MRSTWDLLGAGWARFRRDFVLWVKNVLFQILMSAVVIIGLLLVLAVAFLIVIAVHKSALVLLVLGGLFAAAISIAAIVATVYFLGGTYLTIIAAMVEEQRLSITEYFARGRQHVVRLVTAQLWLLLALFVALCIPLFLLLVGLGVHSGGLDLLAFVAVMAVVIGISLLAVRFSVLPFIVLAEGLGGRPALRRAWGLTEGRWWKTLLVVGATQLVALLVGFLDGIATGNRGVWSDIWSLIYVLISLALTVWTLLVLHEFYRDLTQTER